MGVMNNRHQDQIQQAYRELVREANELARRRFDRVPEELIKDWRKSNTDGTRDDKGRKSLANYTSLGCYPLIYVTRDSSLLCGACAFEEIAKGEAAGIQYMIHWEGAPEYCESCGQEIESAYGDPEELRDGAEVEHV